MKQHVFLADASSANLPDRLQERQAFDIADSAADLGNHDDIDVVAPRRIHWP
jgi:hypothetical protein